MADSPRSAEQIELGGFELIALYIMIGGLSFLPAWGAGEVAALLLPEGSQLPVILGVWLVAAIAINWRLDTSRGKGLERWFRRTAKEFGYPIILLVGIWAGWTYRPISDAQSYVGMAEHAALAACADTPACLRLAYTYNGAADVLYYLPSPDR